MTSVDPGEGKRPKTGAAEMSAVILAILERADRPLTAYGIQAQAAAAGMPLYPTQIYRTVRRLVEEKRVTRIETANAYMATKAATDAIAFCSSCGRAFPVTAGAMLISLTDALAASGFSVSKFVVEAMGNCRECAEK